MITETFDKGAEAAQSWEATWKPIMECHDAMRAMSVRVLRSHLALHGWYPVAATTAALQRDCERVYVIRLNPGATIKLTVGHYTHPTPLKRSEVPWRSISVEHLRLLAAKTAGLE